MLDSEFKKQRAQTARELAAIAIDHLQRNVFWIWLRDMKTMISPLALRLRLLT